MKEFYNGLGKLKWLAWVCLGVFVLGVCFVIIGSKPASEPGVDDELRASGNEQSMKEDSVDVAEICALIEASCDSAGSKMELKCYEKDGMIIVEESYEGIDSDAIDYVRAGLFAEDWATVRTSNEEFGSACLQIARTMGFEGDVVLFTVDYTDTNNVFLAVVNGEIFYDATISE